MDADAFHAFEHDGWERIPDAYHRAFASLTSQSVAPLLDEVGAGRGTRLLDVATGPGYVAAAAADRGAQATGVDFARSMVERAKRSYPGIDFREGDAEALAFPDGSFDAVVMNYGVLHLARPDQALAEARRVLRPGGRFAFTVWAPPEQSIGFGIVLGAIREHGSMEVPVPAGPPFFRFGVPAEACRSLEAAGFVRAQSRLLPQTWRLADAQTLFAWMATSTVRTGALLRAQTAAAREAIRGAVIAAAAAWRRDGALELPMPAVLSSGSRER